MKATDIDQFAAVLVGVYTFYDREISRFAADIWWSALQKFDLPAVTEAFNRHVTNPDVGQFLPKPADIVRLLSGKTQDRALKAWTKVDKAVRQVGTWESVVFDDALIHRVLHEMGGWLAMSQKTDHEWPFVAREFETRYRSHAACREIPAYPPVLIGIAEGYNHAIGSESGPPRLLGNRFEAERVMSGGGEADGIGNRAWGDNVLRFLSGNGQKDGRP